MTQFVQACAGAILAVILILTQEKKKELAILLSLAATCMAAFAALQYLKPVLDFLETLQSLGNLDSDLIRPLLKITGISILSEISSLICQDSGNASLGKGIQLLGTAAILWLSLPMLMALVEMLENILGEL